MQKIFDKDNEKDMEDLWNILPDEAIKARKIKAGIEFLNKDNEPCLYIHNGDGGASIIKINWHDKTEITRPVNYESMIGCVGWFGSKKIKTTLSILKSVDCTYGNPWFECKDGKHWDDFTPAKKSELKFWGDD